MFQRLHDHMDGSGVGLYLVKKVVENAGSRISVRSQLGEVSTFTVILPGQGQPQELRSHEGKVVPDFPLILLVDDDAAARARVLEANNGREALHKLDY